MEKNTFFAKLAAKVFVLALILFSLTACGGGTRYVRGSMEPLKGNERVGVVVPEYRLTRINPTIGAPIHLGEKQDAWAVAKIAEATTAVLARKGLTPVVLPDNEKNADVLKRIKDLPKDGKDIAAPGEVELGNLKGFFAENGIDYLLLVEGDSILSRSAAQQVTTAALSTVATLLTGTFVGGDRFKGALTVRVGIIDADGRISFYNRGGAYPKNFMDAREEVMDQEVSGWIASRK